MPASLWLEISKGGPFDGLPALGLRFEEESAELELGPVLGILLEMSPPPTQLRVLHAAGATDLDPLDRFLKAAASLGMAISADIYGAWESWFLAPAIGWRRLHVGYDSPVPHPVEEIVFHTDGIPQLRPYPFHSVKPPVCWWAPPAAVDLRTIPPGFRLWSNRKPPAIRLWPEEETP